ncbi:Rossmann-fold NAD(P)-binding domain-containing protein [Flammeovirga kamogawensis]|uniref:NAD(P)H-binding protein n=1 Tax=Flammeovirga kamogawensis TaxID=373891 RepID=A0ABX8GWJ1_9BACT|nr:hypothetical protein [Flammeovirga kamogawensis]MBB6460985.1 hypothetical protein [Flammeovirga kamogawensis]QWG07557.1 hypothetical protein KM029_01065 [Flammeovirga kamogawensis]TRX69369.1 hypothetical protein EO216_15005 [Flammeovirga kamogawensis]
MKTIVLFGATGATGSILLEQLINDNQIKKIITFTRQKLDDNDKVVQYILKDFTQLDSININADSVVTCLGTTLKKAGSIEAFEKIDRDLIYQIALWTKNNQIKEFHTLSSVGASTKASNYYLRVKGEMQELVKGVEIENTVFYQPSLLKGADRKEFRLKESASQFFFQLIADVSPTFEKYAPVDVKEMSTFIHQNLFKNNHGVTFYSSSEINSVSFLSGIEYFNKEKIVAKYLFLLGGIIAAIQAVIYSLSSSIFIKGISISILVTSILAFMVGGVILIQIPHYISSLKKELDLGTPFVEALRISKVIKTFNRLLTSELLTLVGGTILGFGFSNQLLQGIGFGAVFSAFTLLLIDTNLISNAKKYNNWFLTEAYK